MHSLKNRKKEKEKMLRNMRMERKSKLLDILVWCPVVNFSCMHILLKKLSLLYIYVLNLPFHSSSASAQSSATGEL